MTSTAMNEAPCAHKPLSTRERHNFALRRLFAKYVDTIFFIVPAILANAIFFMFVSLNRIGGFSVAVLCLLVFINIFVLSALLDALCISRLATTPGKALFFLSIRDPSGGYLTFGRAFRRSLSMTVFGLAFGLPLLSILSHGMAYYSVLTTGGTSWDRDVLVEAKPVTVRQTLLIALLIFFVVMPFLVRFMSSSLGHMQMPNHASVR